MSRIRVLPDQVANQIAAGEVIERPAAVVKELVENALDAGATRVEVEFRHGGRALIRVEDNGRGMSRDDAQLSLERHATSKIAAAADLDRLATFGFRGEALPSIASVSRFLLQTREESSDVGTEILVDGGKYRHVRDCGRPVGTRVEVAQLFNSVPARRKFLKTDQTEAAHIIQTVRLYALACPRTAFSLIENGRVVFRSPECADLTERVGEIFGRQIAEELVPVSAEEAGLRLTGLIGRPGVGRSTRHEMLSFVNARPVDSRTLNYALIESYHQSLPKGRYPVAFVFLEIDPAAVDVNVHPAKREVRFRSEPTVRSFVIRTLLQRLRELGDELPAVTVPSLNPAGSISPVQAVPGAGDSGSRPPMVEGLHPPVPPGWTPPPYVTLTPSKTPFAGAQPVPEVRAPKASGWRFLAVAHGDYALFETAAGIVVLNRRAAHERIWFERIQEQFHSRAVPRQRLLLPVPVELDPIASAMLLDGLPFLRAHGLEIVEFGRHFFRIEGIPSWMEPADAEPFLRDILGAMRDGRLPEGKPEAAEQELARLAAAQAIRLPANVSEAEQMALVAELLSTRTPLTSPSGHPTFIELSHAELDRRFMR